MAKPKEEQPKKLRIKKLTPITNKIATVPSRGTLERYVNRMIAGKTDFDWFDYALKTRQNVLLESPTGAGKSMGIEAYAESKGMAYVSFPFSVGVDSAKMFGKLLPDKTGKSQWAWNDGIFTDIARHGGICELNELNYAREQDLAELNPVLRERVLTLTDNDSEVIRIPDNVLFIATMNPNYEGTRELNKALRNRFAVQLTYEYDPIIEAKLIVSESLLDMAQLIRDNPEVRTPVSTNMLMEFESVIKHLGLLPAITSFSNHFDARKEKAAVKMVTDTHADKIEFEVLDDAPKSPKKPKLMEVDEDQDLSEFGEEGKNWVFVDNPDAK